MEKTSNSDEPSLEWPVYQKLSQKQHLKNSSHSNPHSGSEFMMKKHKKETGQKWHPGFLLKRLNDPQDIWENILWTDERF